MKVHVYKNNIHNRIPIIFYTEIQETRGADYEYLGEMEIEPKLPKKMVTRETRAERIGFNSDGAYRIVLEDPLPPNAGNIRVLFDTEE